ncbi:hypothetical protein A3780_20815 [Kosakonia radicincitans]|nr:hypothetical protein A3780_20815 [Kosakonia radicincitans]
MTNNVKLITPIKKLTTVHFLSLLRPAARLFFNQKAKVYLSLLPILSLIICTIPISIFFSLAAPRSKVVF